MDPCKDPSLLHLSFKKPTAITNVDMERIIAVEGKGKVILIYNYNITVWIFFFSIANAHMIGYIQEIAELFLKGFKSGIFVCREGKRNAVGGVKQY
jgi:hypothetical protein